MAAYSVDAAWASVVDSGPGPFVPALTVLAGKLGEDLHVDDTIPEELARSAGDVGSLLAEWWGWRVPAVTASTYSDTVDTGTGLGMCFSRGVDSWSVLLDRLADPASCPTHLLALDAEPVLPTKTVEALLAGIDDIGEALKIPAVRVATNLRDVLEPTCDWPNESHGSVLAGAALLLRPLLGRTIISATQWTPTAQWWGSHPDLDTRWNVSGWRLLHEDADRRRWQRVVTVSRSQLALDTLQVCFHTDQPSNCGRCEKCLRTMTSLALTGGLNHTDRFEQALTVEAVRALPFTQQFSVDDVIEHLDRAGLEHDELRQAWEEVPVDGSRGQNVTLHRLRRRPLALDESGYSMAARHINPVLDEYAQLRVDHWAERTDDAIPIGWQPSQLGLAPTAAQNAEVLGRLREAPAREELWSASTSGDPGGLHLLEHAHEALGRGLVTADSAITEEVAGQAVYRLWWRENGDLDAVGVLRALLTGTIPVQVMPDSVAQRCRLHLTAPWGHLVHNRSRLPMLTRDYAAGLVDEFVTWLSDHDQEALVKAWQERTGTYD